MTIHLIPEPQYVQVHEEKQIANLPSWSVTLQSPENDLRLSQLAERLFIDVDHAQSTTPSSIYAITLRGSKIDEQMIDRIRGKHDGYVLRVDTGLLEIYATSASGLFYGMKTLKQLLKQNQYAFVPSITIIDWADMQLRSDYLDLRTLYPTFEHIIAYISELARYKINTLVVEYEDKLPFRKLEFLRHPAYSLTEEQHQLLLHTAHHNFVQIIPKQQSFGHLEYILKHPQYIHLRETPEHVGELCPHREGAYEMMADILEEIANLHPHSQYLHMGCDEVWSLGTCQDCQRSGLTREMSFIQFVNRIALKTLSMNKMPMIWHDMLAHATEEEIAKLDKRIIVVVWIYGGYSMKADATSMIRKLRDAGLSVIGASSVRCWDDNGEQNYPVIHNRIKNIQDWTKLAHSEELIGIINTNWSAPFSLGSPYGLFETSRYPAFFAADINWNSRANPDTYLERFFFQYHGVSPEDYSSNTSNYEITDYYQIIPKLLPFMSRNLLTAELINVMLQYEIPAKRRFPLHTFLFRGEWSDGSEEVITCFKEKYQLAYKDLAAVKLTMTDVVSKLLPPEMTDLYITSRYYLIQLYERNLHDILEQYGTATSIQESE
jgi:hexosaminidase